MDEKIESDIFVYSVVPSAMVRRSLSPASVTVITLPRVVSEGQNVQDNLKAHTRLGTIFLQRCPKRHSSQ